MDLCFANMLNYGISLFSVFSLKTLLEESSRVRARQVRQTVEFTGKLLRIRRSLEQHDSLCWPPIGHNFFFAQLESIRMNRGTCSSNVASQGLSHPFLKTFVFVFRDPTDRPWVSEDVYSAEDLENSTGPFSR